MSFKNLVIAVDFSVPSERLLQLASSEAKEENTRIHLIHIIPLEAYPLDGFMKPIIRQWRVEAKKGAQKKMSEYLDQYFPNRTVNLIIEHQNKTVAEDIVDFAKILNANLIMLSTAGAGYLSKLFLGSTTLRILSETDCPVYVLPAE